MYSSIAFANQPLRVMASTLVGNSVKIGVGGAICLSATDSEYGFVVSDSMLANNSAPYGSGGAIAVLFKARLESIRNSYVSNNALNGGRHTDPHTHEYAAGTQAHRHIHTYAHMHVEMHITEFVTVSAWSRRRLPPLTLTASLTTKHKGMIVHMCRSARAHAHTCRHAHTCTHASSCSSGGGTYTGTKSSFTATGTRFVRLVNASCVHVLPHWQYTEFCSSHHGHARRHVHCYICAARTA